MENVFEAFSNKVENADARVRFETKRLIKSCKIQFITGVDILIITK